MKTRMRKRRLSPSRVHRISLFSVAGAEMKDWDYKKYSAIFFMFFRNSISVTGTVIATNVLKLNFSSFWQKT